MKKLVSIALVAAVALPLFAQEAESANEVRAPREERKRESSVWPAFFAVCEFPANPDVIGLRLTIPFSTKQENVTEELKARDQLRWVGLMNSLKQQAEETILTELVYA